MSILSQGQQFHTLLSLVSGSGKKLKPLPWKQGLALGETLVECFSVCEF